MESITTVPGRRPAWVNTPLYKLMSDTFPAYRTRSDVLDIDRLADDLDRSYEAVYQWLRAGRIKRASTARAIVALANREDNRLALADAGREPPQIEAFVPYL